MEMAPCIAIIRILQVIGVVMLFMGRRNAKGIHIKDSCQLTIKLKTICLSWYLLLVMLHFCCAPFQARYELHTNKRLNRFHGANEPPENKQKENIISNKS